MGRFPFGRAATRRPPRQPDGAAELVVLGVYPSALHVRWMLPSGVVVGALAVDDEPEVFWNGAGADDLISRWKTDVGWSDSWGRVGRTAGNGSSGRSVENHVLEPLGVKADRVLFTDCLPTFFVKSGKGSQQERIDSVYDPFAVDAGLEPADLPPRPTPAALVRKAVAEEIPALVEQIENSGSARIVTLGQEAADVVGQLAGTKRKVLDRGEAYGRPSTIRVGSAVLEWSALVHPGNRSRAWVERHSRWSAASG